MANDQEILSSLRRILEQVDQINKRCERIENNNKLTSPEHIVQALAFKQIKNDLLDIKRSVDVLKK